MAHRGLARAPGAGVPVDQAAGIEFGGNPGEGEKAEGRSARADYAMGVSLPSVPAVSLGSSGIPVSRLALGSWRTYERISRDQGIRVMQTAREAGITFLDDARYNDETGRAPIPTGYSEVVFGELFRAAGWRRSWRLIRSRAAS